MRAFAELLDRLAFTPSRNAKLVLVRDYLKSAPDPDRGWALAALTGELDFHAAQFKQQMAAGVPFAVGSDVGPFPHGTQAREYELMVKYGMSPADTLRAGLLNGAKLLDWADSVGQLKPTFFADIIAVPGDPLTDIHVLTKPTFVMKNGEVLRKD